MIHQKNLILQINNPEVIEKIKDLIDDHNKNLNAPIDLLSTRTGVEF